MNRFYLIPNRVKDKNLTLTRQVAGYLRQHGKECSYPEAGTDKDVVPLSMIPEEADCIIVLGGDGTMLSTARSVFRKNIPLLGINLGRMGYLAEVDAEHIYPALKRLISGEFTVEKRMMLEGKIYHAGEMVAQDVALNEIVISREDGLRVIQMDNYINNSYLNTYRADGIILSTPTGSTGYSLSAGGPVVSPSAELFLMTPLAAHTLNSRSVILPSSDWIRIVIGPGRDESVEHAMAYFDSKNPVPMETGDEILITKAEEYTEIVRISSDSFLQTLGKKMGRS